MSPRHNAPYVKHVSCYSPLQKKAAGAGPNVGVTMTGPPTTPVDVPFNLTLTVKSDGTADADNVVVTYPLPPDVNATAVSLPSSA